MPSVCLAMGLRLRLECASRPKKKFTFFVLSKEVKHGKEIYNCGFTVNCVKAVRSGSAQWWTLNPFRILGGNLRLFNMHKTCIGLLVGLLVLRNLIPRVGLPSPAYTAAASILLGHTRKSPLQIRTFLNRARKVRNNGRTPGGIYVFY